jgi:hypothetical protein
MAQRVQQQAQQQVAQAQLKLREITVAEVVARAINKKRRLGKESNRITLFLFPQEIPPASGSYQTALGETKIHSTFLADRGQWCVVVRLPNEEGFKVKDHLPPSDNPTQS